ncbi:MAG: ABC-2 transporter permease [Clostridiales bacterium]|nr:ABC-2 transporter permease [Clostridiales bacterium]
MSNLLRKNFKLCFIPLIAAFYLFALMLLIPNYIYLIPCFFTTNAIFYMFQRCVLNNDFLYTSFLPVSKRDSVKAMFILVVIIELVMLALYVPMIFLNRVAVSTPNSAGVDTSVTLIAMGFCVFSIFNLVFLPSFYKTAYKAGNSFLKASVAVFCFIFVSEGVFIAANSLGDKVGFFGWIKDHLDCWPGSAETLVPQLIVLAAAVVIFAALTMISLKRSEKNFEMVDL